MNFKVGYWIATGLFAAGMAFAAYGYLTGNVQAVVAFRHLGYPDYFRTLVGRRQIPRRGGACGTTNSGGSARMGVRRLWNQSHFGGRIVPSHR